MLVLNLNMCCKACHWQYDGTESCDKSDNTGTRHQSGNLSDMVALNPPSFHLGHQSYNDGTESCDKSDNTGTRHQSGKLSDMVIFSFALFSTTQTEYMYRYDWLIIIMSLLDMIHGL